MTAEIGHRVPAVLKAWETTFPEARGYGAQMGENLTGYNAAAACLAALCLSGAALAQAPSPIRDTGVRGAAGDIGARGAIGAPGVVVRYEESASAGIVYHEEAGSMLSTIPPPVKAVPRRAPAASEPARKQPAVAEAVPAPPAPPAAAPSKVAERRALAADGASAKR